MTRPLALAASLHDAAALAGAFGPGSVLSVGGPGGDIVAPAGTWLSQTELLAAARRGGGSYFLAFGNAAPAEAGQIAPLMEALSEAVGTGFMAACLAAPWAGRTIYQGHMFEGGRHVGDVAQLFAAALGRPVAKVTHETVRAGGAAIKRACTAVKEQGRALALIDAIDDDDAVVIAEALAGMAVTGGAAWLAARPHGAEPPRPEGRLAILAGAMDRMTNLQIGALRGLCEVHELNFGAPDPVAAVLSFARMQPGPVVITSGDAPDRPVSVTLAATVLGEVAAGLVEMGVQRLIVTGEELGHAVLDATRTTTLVAGAAMGPLRWLRAERATICFKPAGIGTKNLFLSEVEPQIRLNAAAK